MLWDPFLIKKLLKSVICGTINSAQMHCSQLTKSTIAAEPKKKKKRKTQLQNVDAGIISIQTVTESIWIYLILLKTENTITK